MDQKITVVAVAVVRTTILAVAAAVRIIATKVLLVINVVAFLAAIIGTDSIFIVVEVTTSAIAINYFKGIQNDCSRLVWLVKFKFKFGLTKKFIIFSAFFIKAKEYFY